jgi:hypothetical protein
METQRLTNQRMGWWAARKYLEYFVKINFFVP